MANARFLYANLFQGAAAALTASSTEPAFPIAWLRDQQRGKTWRSRAGYNVGSSDRDKLDFKEAGVARVATLAVGNYATATLYAAQVQAAMNAAPGAVNTYFVTYDAATHKFTIARNTGAAAVILPFATGASLARSAHADLGFTDADKSGLTSYLADGVSYHSREWVKVDLGSAQAATAAVAINFNCLGTITLQGNATDAWSAPTLSQVLSGNNAILLAFFGSSSQRWWRFLLSDVANPDGFSELGIVYVGPYTQPTIGYSVSLSDDPEELSAVDVAIQGAHFQDSRPIRDVWSLEWEEIQEADRAILEAWADATRRGKTFFFSFQAVADPVDTLYCFRAGGLRRQYVGPAPGGGGYWTLSVTLAEALA